MNINQKGFANIILIVLVVVLTGASGYFFLTRNPAQQEQPTTLSPSIQGPTTQTPTPTTVVEKPSVPSTTGSFRIISCNPRVYDSEYFKQEKPCVSDMSAVDIERENKALSIINKAIAAKPSLQYTYGSLPQIYISHNRYQVVKVSLAPKPGFVIVDTISEKITDFFSPFRQVPNLTDKVVFIERNDSGEIVRQYNFGSEKSVTLANTEIYKPQTYFYYDGAMGSAGVKVLSTAVNSITLGVYDRSKLLPQKPGNDFVQYEQVGTKVINLVN